jgi:large subunit ribosomal protein L25
MKAVYQFDAAKRENIGGGAARALRRTGSVPAIMYSNKLEPVSFALVEKDLTREYKKGAFLSKLVEIRLEGKTFFALPRDIQLHPVSDRIQHADFLQVDADSQIRVQVPVKILNADKSIGLKLGGALNIVRHTVELLCSPDSIPSRIEVDIRSVNIGDSIHISAIELPANVTPVIKRDFTLITITGRSVSSDDEATPAAAAPAAGGKAAPAKAAPKAAPAKAAGKK